MLYPLSEVQRMVDEWVNPGNIETESVISLERNGCIKNAGKEANNFISYFMQGAAKTNTREGLQMLVETSVAGSTSLANKLHRFYTRLEETKEADGETVQSLKNLESVLIDQVQWLHEWFPLYFNENQPLPLATEKKEKEKLAQEWKELEKKLRAEETSELAGIIIKVVEVNIVSQSLTYRQLSYFQTVCAEIKSRETGALDCNGITALAGRLIACNFNDPAFIHYLVKQFQKEAEDITSLAGQSAQWSWYAKAVQQVQTSAPGLYPGQPSVKAALREAIKEERKYLEQKKESLAAVYGKGENNTAPAAKTNGVLTNLSVSQLAVFCRLLCDCNIIRQGNQTELLKTIAGALQTTRTLSISAESLRVKYYAPDPAAINIVKEHLHQMLGQLKKY